MKKLVFLTLLLIAGINYLGATNFTVSNNADTGTGSLRAAITAANADTNVPHTITTNAAYTITLASALPQITKAMTINATGTNLLTINCPAGIAASTMNIAASTGNVVLNYLVLQNASVLPTSATVNGGALTIGGSNTVTINNCQFLNNVMSTNNTAYDVNGGAINISTGATVTINDSWFEGNIVKSTTSASTRNANGGAIHNNGSLTINNSTFKNNSTKRESPATAGNTMGGAIRTYGNLNCNNCVFDGNYAQTNGASIYSASVCTIEISNSVVKNSTGNGAAVSAVLSGSATTIAGMATLNISNSLITNNVNSSNSTYGGGVFAAANATVNNTEISGNSACRGGGITLGTGLTNTNTSTTYKTKLTMIGCTVSGNSLNGLNASALGGGVYVQGASSDLTDNCIFTNCTVSGNSTPAVGGTVTTSAGGGVNVGGGGTDSWVTSCTFNNCTITGNSSQGNITTSKGGGIDRDKGKAILNYCIVAGNNSNSTVVATNANKDLNVVATNLGSTTGRNLFGGAATFSLTGSTETTGNVPNVSDISTILNTTLTDNSSTTALPGGGYVKTHALVGGGSAINPTAASVGLQTADQRGVTRDATPDMGAYEFIGSASSVTSGSSNWSSATAWVNNNIPSPGADVTVQNELTVDQNVSVGTLTVNAGKMLTLSSGKSLTATNFTLNSTENIGTATFVDANPDGGLTVTVPNATNVYQFISKTGDGIGVTGRNWYISSPLTAATSSTITTATGNGLVYYDGTTNWPAAGATMEVMKGYIAKSPAQNTTINFNGGTLNTGSQSVSNLPLGFNLVGNPYASYVNFSQATRTGIDNSIWYRSKKTGAYKFHTYNVISEVHVNDGTAIIPPMQSFWIKTTNATNTLGFTNAMRLHQDQTVEANRLKAPKAPTQQLLRLQVSNGVNTDETVVYFNPNAQNTVDDYDSQKLFNNVAEVPEIFTKNGSTNLVINGMNEIPYDTQISLGFVTGKAGSFSISATELKNFEAGTRILLKDNTQPAIETELREDVTFNFNADISSASTDRFSLIFRSAGATTRVSSTEKLQAKVFVNETNQISITAPVKSNYAIYNAIGMLIENGILISELQTVNSKLRTGVYLVKVENTSFKVIIK